MSPTRSRLPANPSRLHATMDYLEAVSGPGGGLRIVLPSVAWMDSATGSRKHANSLVHRLVIAMRDGVEALDRFVVKRTRIVPVHLSSDTPDWARGVGRLVVFSGAGISTDSGIPDFRGSSGAWTRNPAAEKSRTFQAFMSDPELRASYWRSRYEHPVWRAEPNAGHLAVASLADSDLDPTVVTQNTDGLHQRAGTPANRVIELHGTMHSVACVGCGHRSATGDVLARVSAGEAIPHCLQCGGIMKTASTMFGETVSPAVFARAERAVTSCDLLLAVGTSLAVEPAASLCATAVHAGATLVIANLNPTPYDSIATEVIREPLSEALPRLARQLRAAAGRPVARPASGAGPSGTGPFARPTLLLRAEARTARFRSREGELDRLTAWCRGTGVATHLMWGPAGVGKTRLALELTDRLTATGEWEVEYLASDAVRLAVPRPLLVVVDDAETRLEQVADVMRAASTGRSGHPTRVLLLARTRDGWWDTLRPQASTCAELAPPDKTRSGRTDAVQEVARDYLAALAAMGVHCSAPVRSFFRGLADGPLLPGGLQAAVLAGLLGPTEAGGNALVSHELTALHRASEERELRLPAEAVAGAVVTALLCGAADENSASAALSHLPALRDPACRIRVAQWLRDMYPPVASGSPRYWEEVLPDPLAEDLVAAMATPQFLMGMLMETTEEQDRRALTVLARAAATRPALRVRLTELLSTLPGVSPAAIEVAVSSGYPTPFAEALTSLVRTAALPAELLEAVPPGTTVLGEFPVLLAADLVDAYERRAKSETGLRGLTSMLIQLAERLTDLGRAEPALAAAQRSVETAARLAEPVDCPARAAAALRRAAELVHRDRGEIPTDGELAPS